MRHGIVLFTSDRGIAPTTLARAAEERGFDTFYVPEHTHIPVRRDAAHPGTGDESLPDDRYLRTLDPWVTLGACASVTSTIRLATAVALPVEHDPITLAKSVATLDHLSGGRVTIGAGFGWNTDELGDHHVPAGKRRTVLKEYLEAMRALWTEDEASYDGEFVSFGPSWAYPKPAQGRIPVIIGAGAGPKTFDWIAANADGWMTTPTTTDVAANADKLRKQIIAEATTKRNAEVDAAKQRFAPVQQKAVQMRDKAVAAADAEHEAAIAAISAQLTKNTEELAAWRKKQLEESATRVREEQERLKGRFESDSQLGPVGIGAHHRARPLTDRRQYRCERHLRHHHHRRPPGTQPLPISGRRLLNHDRYRHSGPAHDLPTLPRRGAQPRGDIGNATAERQCERPAHLGEQKLHAPARQRLAGHDKHVVPRRLLSHDPQPGAVRWRQVPGGAPRYPRTIRTWSRVADHSWWSLGCRRPTCE